MRSCHDNFIINRTEIIIFQPEPKTELKHMQVRRQHYYETETEA